MIFNYHSLVRRKLSFMPTLSTLSFDTRFQDQIDIDDKDK